MNVKAYGVCLAALLLLSGCQPRSDRQISSRTGRLVVTKSAGPKTFNRLLSADDQTNSITGCLNSSLVRINRQTLLPEAELASSWQSSPDGRVLTFALRPGVKFSDGHVFTADDVLFTFQLINDPKITTTVSDQFGFEGRRVAVEKIDDHTVRFTFPAPYAAAERLFDGIPMLPRHALEQAYREGRFEQVWSPAAAPEQIIGLGPFRLKEYKAGERIVLARNEHYWKTEAGRHLPLVDELVFEIVPDRNAQLLRFQNGESDLLSPVSAEDLATLAPLAQQGRISITDAGPGMIRELFWFNLNNGRDKATGRPLVDPVKLAWFQQTRFRQAVSHAIDRDAIVRLAFAGRAEPQWGFLSSGDKLWYQETRKYPPDLSRARTLLAEAGFKWEAEGGALRDAQGHLVEFTLLTNSGNALRQKISTLIQSDLARLGIKVNLAAIEARALLGRINERFDYEACLLALVSGDADPNAHTDILVSSGSGHWWHPRQTKPATPWEARIDELMQQQRSTLSQPERKKLFAEVQQIMAEEQPFIFLATRHLIVAARTDIGNLKPALLPDFVLWNCEELFGRER
jgi:peptide/nickel transport system substrate-binding protein